MKFPRSSTLLTLAVALVTLAVSVVRADQAADDYIQALCPPTADRNQVRWFVRTPRGHVIEAARVTGYEPAQRVEVIALLPAGAATLPLPGGLIYAEHEQEVVVTFFPPQTNAPAQIQFQPVWGRWQHGRIIVIPTAAELAAIGAFHFNSRGELVGLSRQGPPGNLSWQPDPLQAQSNRLGRLELERRFAP